MILNGSKNLKNNLDLGNNMTEEELEFWRQYGTRQLLNQGGLLGERSPQPRNPPSGMPYNPNRPIYPTPDARRIPSQLMDGTLRAPARSPIPNPLDERARMYQRHGVFPRMQERFQQNYPVESVMENAMGGIMKLGRGFMNYPKRNIVRDMEGLRLDSLLSKHRRPSGVTVGVRPMPRPTPKQAMRGKPYRPGGALSKKAKRKAPRNSSSQAWDEIQERKLTRMREMLEEQNKTRR